MEFIKSVFLMSMCYIGYVSSTPVTTSSPIPNLDWLENPCDGQTTTSTLDKEQLSEQLNLMYTSTSSLKNYLYQLEDQTGDRIQSPFLRDLYRRKSHQTLTNQIFPHVLEWELQLNEIPSGDVPDVVRESLPHTYINFVRFATYINQMKHEETTHENNVDIIQLHDNILTKTKSLMCGNVVLLNYYEVNVPVTEFSIPEHLTNEEVISTRRIIHFQISHKSFQYTKSLKKYFSELKTLIES